MKIVFLFILCSIYQAQDIDEPITSTQSPLTDQTEMKFSSLFPLFTNENEIIPEKKDEWLNINRTKSLIFWKKISRSRYSLRSEGECLRQMCSIKLKYNGRIPKGKDGCLAFILQTNGQPMGQLWIEEDQQKESFKQKIQLTNTTLRVEHSLKSNIKYLSIDTRVLFRDAQIDSIILTNLNLNWKGSCPPDSSKITSFEEMLTDQSTFSTEFTNDYSDILTTEEITNQTESTTIKSKLKRQDFPWILSLITFFCFSTIILSILYGFWSIQSHSRLIWHLSYNRPIQLLFRRSLRSSTRSSNRVGTLAELTNEIFYSENSISTWTIDSIQSTISNTQF